MSMADAETSSATERMVMSTQQFRHIAIWSFAAVVYVLSVGQTLPLMWTVVLGVAGLSLPTAIILTHEDLRSEHRRRSPGPAAIAVPFICAVGAVLVSSLPGMWPLIAGAALAVGSAGRLYRQWPPSGRAADGESAA